MANRKKEEGNVHYRNGNYMQAIRMYSDAIDIYNSDPTFYSNRSACYTALNMWKDAINDGYRCIQIDKLFLKGYFRCAYALSRKGDYKDAMGIVKRAEQHGIFSKDLKELYYESLKELTEERRRDRTQMNKESLERTREGSKGATHRGDAEKYDCFITHNW